MAVDSDLISLDVGADMTLADLKAVIQSDINTPPEMQHLFYNNRLLTDDSQTLSQVGIGPGDLLGMHIRAQSQPPQRDDTRRTGTRNLGPQGALSRGQQMIPDPEDVRLHMLGDPRVLDSVRGHNPQLAEAADNAQRFREVLLRQQREEADAEAAKEAHIAMLNADPFNLDSQRAIEETIRRNAVTENLQTAMEHTPEGIVLNTCATSSLNGTC